MIKGTQFRAGNSCGSHRSQHQKLIKTRTDSKQDGGKIDHKDPETHHTIIKIKTDTSDRRRTKGDQPHDTFGTNHIRNKSTFLKSEEDRDKIWCHQVQAQPTFGNT